jgi:hypothetical protein
MVQSKWIIPHHLWDANQTTTNIANRKMTMTLMTTIIDQVIADETTTENLSTINILKRLNIFLFLQRRVSDLSLTSTTTCQILKEKQKEGTNINIAIYYILKIYKHNTEKNKNSRTV